MSEKIIPVDRSIIVAADVRGDKFTALVDQTADVEGISAYKLGFKVGYSRLSLPVAVEYVHDKTNKKVVLDHQKAGNDIPDTGKDFAEVAKDANVDAAIVFPFTGPNVEEAWVKALQDEGIGVLVGAEMTHDNIAGDKGYIRDDAFERMFDQAIDLNVSDFVVPGNKPDKVAGYRNFFEERLGEGNFTLYAPGFVAQGGEISEAGQAAGKNWHAIVGRGIIAAADVHVAAVEYTQQILAA